MIIIWGSKNKERVVSGGSFACPTCRRMADYSLMQISRYFTLYFVPLFSTGTLGEYVRCHSCGGSFASEAQYLTAAAIVTRDLPFGSAAPAAPLPPAVEMWVCGVCGQDNLVSYPNCGRCDAWTCRHCHRDNPATAQECLRCRGVRGS